MTARGAHYFAYGSNLHPGRLGDRLGPVERVGAASVTGWRLRFCKRGQDGSAKCTLLPAPGEQLWGALYRLRADQWAELDVYEGLGAGYTLEAVVVQNGGAPIAALTYVAEASHIDHALLPFRWYRDLVAIGADHAALPDAHVTWLRSHPSRDDPRPARRARMRALVATLAGTP